MNPEQELATLQERNRRVEADKAWETSPTRKIVLAVVTYVVAAVTLSIIHASNPWLTALVPTLGFWLSTLTLPPIKRWWINKRRLDG